MIRSKTRKLIEGLMADTLQKRVRFNITRYGPGVSYLQNKAWINFDGKEIFSCSTMGWIRENSAVERMAMSLDTLRQIGFDTLLGIVAFLPGYFLSMILIKKGVIRDNSTLFFLCLSIGISVLFPFIFQFFTWLWIKLILLLIININGPLRRDLWTTLRKGRWWWLKE